NLIPFGREPGTPSKRGNSSLRSARSAQGGDHVDAAAFTLGAKDDLRAVRREAWLVIIRGITSQPDRFSTGHLLDPDVQVSFSAAVRGIGQQPAVGRQCRIQGKARVKCEARHGGGRW